MNRQLQKEPWAGAGAIHCESPTGMNDSQKREATGGGGGEEGESVMEALLDLPSGDGLRSDRKRNN